MLHGMTAPDRRVARPTLDGYRPETYGDRIADVYDDWYHGVSDVDATVALVGDLVGPASADILELAVGSGRLALPLAQAGHRVTGIDVSEGMLDHLRARDVDGRITVIVGDMVDDLPVGRFDLVVVAYNSLFMLADPARQAACFAAVAGVLEPNGRFVVEAFVPYDPPRRGTVVEVRTMTTDRVVLAVTDTDPDSQVVTGQYVDLVHDGPTQLRPFVLRYSTPPQLDAFAAAAGLVLDQRWEDVGGTPFDEESGTHLSVYRLADDG